MVGGFTLHPSTSSSSLAAPPAFVHPFITVFALLLLHLQLRPLFSCLMRCLLLPRHPTDHSGGDGLYKMERMMSLWLVFWTTTKKEDDERYLWNELPEITQWWEQHNYKWINKARDGCRKWAMAFRYFKNNIHPSKEASSSLVNICVGPIITKSYFWVLGLAVVVSSWPGP